MYTLLPAWVPELKDREDIYFRYSKRNKVPVYLFGAGMNGRVRRECYMTDILPTICGLIGIPVSYTSVGRSMME